MLLKPPLHFYKLKFINIYIPYLFPYMHMPIVELYFPTQNFRHYFYYRKVNCRVTNGYINDN